MFDIVLYKWNLCNNDDYCAIRTDSVIRGRAALISGIMFIL